jgi:protein-S-isoprenylcysteine O-methyltransferase Ste14
MPDQNNASPAAGLDPKSLKKKVILRILIVFLLMGTAFFLPAWTFNYWQAWAYLVVISVPMAFVVTYLFKHDPALLERRMRMKEKQEQNALIVAVSWILFLLAFVLPGFDHRLHWSQAPLFVIIIADLLVLGGYLFVISVFKANSFASRIVEIEKGQKVITTGPYRIVRHPMYFGVIFFYVFSPLALGSYWAMIPAALIVPLLVLRIKREEKELLENLKEYKAYTEKTKHRLIPGIW